MIERFLIVLAVIIIVFAFIYTWLRSVRLEYRLLQVQKRSAEMGMALNESLGSVLKMQGEAEARRKEVDRKFHD